MLELTMRLDHTQLEKVKGYYVYRSEETEDDRPVVDGLYVQRQALGGPQEMSSGGGGPASATPRTRVVTNSERSLDFRLGPIRRRFGRLR